LLSDPPELLDLKLPDDYVAPFEPSQDPVHAIISFHDSVFWKQDMQVHIVIFLFA
jgi:hypothetical protein